jgi:hypothetical protein
MIALPPSIPSLSDLRSKSSAHAVVPLERSDNADREETRSRMQSAGVYKEMTRTLGTVLLWLLIAGFAVAEAQTPLTVCEVVDHLDRFAGRIVTVRAKVDAGFEIFAIEDLSGECGMWLHYAGGGPSAMASSTARTPKAPRAGLNSGKTPNLKGSTL